jgi:hypothetical protein
MRYRVDPGTHVEGDSVTTVGVRRTEGRGWIVEAAVHRVGRAPQRREFRL